MWRLSVSSSLLLGSFLLVVYADKRIHRRQLTEENVKVTKEAHIEHPRHLLACPDMTFNITYTKVLEVSNPTDNNVTIVVFVRVWDTRGHVIIDEKTYNIPANDVLQLDVDQCLHVTYVFPGRVRYKAVLTIKMLGHKKAFFHELDPKIKPCPNLNGTCNPIALKALKGKKFKDLWDKYPTPAKHGTIAFWKLAGFGNRADILKLTGTCAARLSYTMYQAGVDIDIDLKHKCNWSKEKNRYQQNNRQKYIIRAETWYCFLEKCFKAPKCVNDLNKLKGMKGIISFRKCTFKDAQGHCDLWDGKDCKNECYPKKCKEFCLFAMP